MSSQDLALRVVSVHSFRFLPGMLVYWRAVLPGRVAPWQSLTTADLWRVVGKDEEFNTLLIAPEGRKGGMEHARPEDLLPVLDDPATLGCLEHLVREAWSDAQVVLCRDADPGKTLDGLHSIIVNRRVNGEWRRETSFFGRVWPEVLGQALGGI